MSKPSENSEHPQYQPLGLIAAAVGLLWLLSGLDANWLGLLLSAVPAGLLLSTGVAACLYAGDPRINQMMALGSVLGFVLAFPGSFLFGPLTALSLAAASAGAALLASKLALGMQPTLPGVPAPLSDPKMWLKVVPDNVMLAYFVGSAKIPTGQHARTVAAEVEEALEQMRSQRWDKRPERFHRTPSLPADVTITPASTRKYAYEHVRWPSEFVPNAGFPGAERFERYTANRTMHGWMMRHDDHAQNPARPWLMGIHGYRMGKDWLDFTLFSPGWLHHKLGFNVFMPVLPLHGHRRFGWRSGDGYLEGEFLDLLHAQSQALFDLRTAAAWLRAEQGASTLSLMGFSLGGYNASLLSAVDGGFANVIAGIPVVDFSTALWRHFPAVPRMGIEALGIERDTVAELLKPVSPLSWPCRVKHRAIFAGTADQLIGNEQILSLAGHWGIAQPCWFQGSHLSVRRETVVRGFVETAMVDAGVLSPEVATRARSQGVAGTA